MKVLQVQLLISSIYLAQGAPQALSEVKRRELGKERLGLQFPVIVVRLALLMNSEYI